MDIKIIFDGEELILMGFKKVNILNPTFMFIDFKSFSLKFFGQNLSVNYYSQKELSIKGNIERIEKYDEL